MTLVNLAHLYHSRGDSERAELFALEARALSEASGFDDQLNRLESLGAGEGDKRVADLASIQMMELTPSHGG